MATDYVVKGNPARLQHVITSDDTEVPTDATGNVVVTITASDGVTQLSTGNATKIATGTYTYTAWTPAALDTDVTVTWVATLPEGVTTDTTRVNVVGTWPFTIYDLRQWMTQLSSTTDFPVQPLRDARSQAIDWVHRLAPTALVPSFKRHTVSRKDLSVTTASTQVFGGQLRVVLPHRNVTAFKSLKIDGVSVSLSTLTLNGPTGIITGIFDSIYGNAYPYDYSQFVFEYEYGHSSCPPLAFQPLMALAADLAMPQAGSPRITSIASEIGFQRISTANSDGSTGIPSLDAVLAVLGGGPGSGF